MDWTQISLGENYSSKLLLFVYSVITPNMNIF